MCTPIWTRYTVYFIIVCDVVLSFSSFIKGMTHLKDGGDAAYAAAVSVPAAVIFFFMGILLGLGVYQNNEQYVFAYIVIRTAVLSYATLFLVIVMELVGASGVVVFVILLIIAIMWGLKYNVYLYYKQMIQHKEANVIAGDFAITYNEKDATYVNNGASLDNTAV